MNAGQTLHIRQHRELDNHVVSRNRTNHFCNRAGSWRVCNHDNHLQKRMQVLVMTNIIQLFPRNDLTLSEIASIQIVDDRMNEIETRSIALSTWAGIELNRLRLEREGLTRFNPDF